MSCKSKLLSSGCELCIADKPVAWLSQKPAAAHEQFYKEDKFAYAITLAPELPLNSPVRQLLLAFSVAIRRVNA